MSDWEDEDVPAVAVPVVTPGQWDDEDVDDDDVADSWDAEDEDDQDNKSPSSATSGGPPKKKKTLAQKIAERKAEEERRKAELIKVNIIEILDKPSRRYHPTDLFESTTRKGPRGNRGRKETTASKGGHCIRHGECQESL